MVKLTLKLSLLMTALFIFFSSEADDSIHVGISLNEIDIDVNHPIKMIMKDVLSEKKDCTSMFYTVFLVRHDTAATMYITQETSHQLMDSDDYRDYFTIDNDTVIIRTPDSKDFKFRRNSKKSTFAVSMIPPMTYHPDKWKYYFYSDGFARYINGIGWVWLRRPKDMPDSNKALLTIPQRLLKSDRHVTEND